MNLYFELGGDDRLRRSQENEPCTVIRGDPDRGWISPRKSSSERIVAAAFRGDARVATWLYAVARNHCLNAISRRESDPPSRSDTFPLGRADELGDRQCRCGRREKFERAWRIIKRVIALHYAHELTLRRITRELMLSNPSGAKAYIVKARRKLKRALDDHKTHTPRRARHAPRRPDAF